MGQNNSLSSEANGIEAEQQKLEEVRVLLKAFDVLGRAFATIATAEEIKSAQGRLCILDITGLNHHQARFFFQVVGLRIRQVPPFQYYNTYIGAPIDCVIRVLKGVLDGDETAFSKEWARGQAKIIIRCGERKFMALKCTAPGCTYDAEVVVMGMSLCPDHRPSWPWWWHPDKSGPGVGKLRPSASSGQVWGTPPDRQPNDRVSPFE